MGSVDSAKMERAVFSVSTLADEGDDRAFWRTQTHEDCLAALELMRQIMYGYDPATARLQGVLTAANLAYRGTVDGH